ncbi:uncharacterized protein BcabD6B2_06450 [Babesia caballi]|uniref:Variant erythrocyte surface antigen-1, beta subunit n=1 Tax=Babesia caballi TaxID=5871 RepID=A0AAV4LMP9_BABCB|nr:hypothetical protein, conserved [Babesia caballi]
MDGVKPFSPELGSKLGAIKQALKAGGVDGIIGALGEGLTKFKEGIKDVSKYKSAYDQNIGAKIFLGCLPLYYNALTYLYWGCTENGGGWREMKFNDRDGSMRSYFDSQGLLPLYVDKSKTGAHIADSALKGFTELQQGMTAASSSPFTYSTFTKELEKKVRGNSQQLPTTCPLAALFYGASCYFRCQQTATAKSVTAIPKTIREMLYFLAGLQFSSAYDDINGHIDTVLSTALNVADSSQKTDGNTLSADQLKEYLRASCAFSSSVLGMIQGPGASQNNSDPWLHSLFSNSQFNLNFQYPSGAFLFSKVSNYSYALQLQLSFLYIQCRDTYTKACGWHQCRCGQGINSDPQRRIVQSHICLAGCSAGGHTGGNHASGPCQHAGCGESPKPSPLQAFLTDKLKGFSRGHPSDPSSHLATCFGSLCHVPMGFHSENLRQNAGTGNYIYAAFYSFCGTSSSPLRQLSEKLGCLTKRTPRTLGDLFGFLWHLKGQLSATLNNITNAEWLRDLKVQLPFSYQLKNESGQKLLALVVTAHTDSHHDLTSLYSSGCNQPNENCGPYLYPLTHSDGATYAPTHASIYLSWILYLSDDLQSWFQDLLGEFKDIDCSKTGCKSKTGGPEACKSQHPPGTHGISNACTCDSVVHCGGVLPLLYRYGFRFLSAFKLKGVGNGNGGTKRTCANFHSQLQSVISGNPLSNLLTSIDAFLYAIRWEFFSKLSGFWTIYMCLILYTFFFLLDTLHLRSHLKLTTSHTLPPLALLTAGTHPPITKLTYITQ